MRSAAVLLAIEPPVAVIWLNRPKQRNALTQAMLTELGQALSAIESNRTVRALVLAGHGDSLCAGIEPKSADIKSGEEFGSTLRSTLEKLKHLPIPSIARAQGEIRGYGVGLVAACDVAISPLDANFCLSAKTHLVEIHAQYDCLSDAISGRQLKRLMLTGEIFPAADAYRFGLIHDLTRPEELDGRINEELTKLLEGEPRGHAATKHLFRVPRAKESATHATAARVRRKS